MDEKNLDNSLNGDNSSTGSNRIDYVVSNVTNAFNCLHEMKKLENTPNFGKLTYKSNKNVTNTRYTIDKYVDKIDSPSYTSSAIKILAYNINYLSNQFEDVFSDDLITDTSGYLSDEDDASLLDFGVDGDEYAILLSDFTVDDDLKVKDVGVETEYKTLSDGTKYQVNAIGAVDENTPIILIDHGAGGGGNGYGGSNGENYDYSYLDNWLKSDGVNGVNALVIRYNRAANSCGVDASNILKQVSEDYSVSLSNVVTAGFSAGGEPSMKQMADLVRSDSNIENSTVMLIDGYLQSKPSKVINSEDLEALGENNTVLFAINQKGITCDMGDYAEWTEKYGIKVIRLEDNSYPDHHGVLNNYFKNGLLDFETGQGAFPDGTYSNGNEYYSATVYDVDKGEWVPFDISGKTLSEVYEMFDLDYSKKVSTAEDEETDFEQEEDKEEIKNEKDDLITGSYSDTAAVVDEFGELNSILGRSLYDKLTIVDENNNVVRDGKEYVENRVKEIRQNYSGREKTYYTSLLFAELCIEAGGKLPYVHQGTASTDRFDESTRLAVPTATVARGVDCNAWASYLIFGDDSETKWLTVGQFADAGDVVPFSDAQVGDVFANGKHVGVVLANNSENGTLLVTDARGEGYGVVFREVSYDALKKDGHKIVDMSNYYDGSNVPAVDTSDDASESDTIKPVEDVSVEETPTPVEEPSETVKETPAPIEEPSEVETEPTQSTGGAPNIGYKPSKPTIDTSKEETKPIVEEVKPTENVSETPKNNSEPSVTPVIDNVKMETESSSVVEEIPEVDTESLDNDIVENSESDKTVVEIVTDAENNDNNLENDSSMSSGNSNNGGFDAKKIVLPGILGTGLALLSAKIGKMMKKSKKNNDV